MANGDDEGFIDSGSWDSGGGGGGGSFASWENPSLGWGMDPATSGGGFDQGALDQSSPFDVSSGAASDRTWGQQLGDWLGLSDATQGKLANAAKQLKASAGDLKAIQQLADPMAPKPGQAATTGGPPPSQTRPAQSLDELLQQLYQRRQQLAALGLSGRPWAPRGPGGGLLGAS